MISYQMGSDWSEEENDRVWHKMYGSDMPDIDPWLAFSEFIPQKRMLLVPVL